MIQDKGGHELNQEGARFLNEEDNHDQGGDRSMKLTKAQKKDDQD